MIIPNVNRSTFLSFQRLFLGSLWACCGMAAWKSKGQSHQHSKAVWGPSWSNRVISAPKLFMRTLSSLSVCHPCVYIVKVIKNKTKQHTTKQPKVQIPYHPFPLILQIKNRTRCHLWPNEIKIIFFILINKNIITRQFFKKNPLNDKVCSWCTTLVPSLAELCTQELPRPSQEPAES